MKGSRRASAPQVPRSACCKSNSVLVQAHTLHCPAHSLSAAQHQGCCLAAARRLPCLQQHAVFRATCGYHARALHSMLARPLQPFLGRRPARSWPPPQRELPVRGMAGDSGSTALKPRSAQPRSVHVLFQRLHQRGLGHGADDGVALLAVLEEHDCGDAADAVFSRNPRALVCVQLQLHHAHKPGQRSSLRSDA